MRRTALVAALVALSATPATGKAKRRGKVVRIERGHTRTKGALRMCSNPQSDGRAVCYGQAPRVGESGTVVDETGVHGTLGIIGVEPVPDSCGNPTSWNIVSNVTSGDLSTVSWSGAVMLDYQTSPRAKVLVNNPAPIPPGHPSETMMIEVDNDGDDTPEILETWYHCDASNNDVTPWTSGQQGWYCLVYYQRRGALYDELRVDNVKNCY